MLYLTRELPSVPLSPFRCGFGIIGFSLIALAVVACSKALTKDELLARAKEAVAAQDYVMSRRRKIIERRSGCRRAIRWQSANWRRSITVKGSSGRVIRCSRKPPSFGLTTSKCSSILLKAALRSGISSRRTTTPSRPWKNNRETPKR